MTQARSYFLDIVCPYVTLVKGSSSGSADSSLDGIHSHALKAQKDLLHGADLFKNPGATWPAELQPSIDVIAANFVDNGAYFGKVAVAKSVTEIQGLPRPQQDTAKQSKAKLMLLLPLSARSFK
ncbi:hypothetical protein [Frigoribacterium sp. UYMn621]|uniref:hypothetical protein n=1 Tax=Frigoribacterium sp. UYMn621 TaxID=3156343 RepID=UPI003399EDDF